jgi:predicted nuclease of predicted toxin-antitoxin system
VKVLVDMNLSPEWVTFFTAQGFEAQHWSSVGVPQADDREIMEFA